MWSCQHCNWTKGDYPKPGRAIGNRRVIKVDEENPRAHLELSPNPNLLSHKTPTGEFNIRLMRLNRQTLLRLRAIRRKLSTSNEYIAHGMFELLNIPLDVINAQHRGQVQKLRERLGKDYEKLIKTVRDFIEAEARSELIDPEPGRTAENAARREYLRSEDAIGSQLTTVPTPRKAPKGRGRKTK
jgi:hypothetical protein